MHGRFNAGLSESLVCFHLNNNHVGEVPVTSGDRYDPLVRAKHDASFNLDEDRLLDEIEHVLYGRDLNGNMELDEIQGNFCWK